MTSPLLRWIATHPPCSTIARWIGGVRAEIAAGDAHRQFVDTSPEIFDPAHSYGRFVDMFEDVPTESELRAMRGDIKHVRDILDGKSPSDLPHCR